MPPDGNAQVTTALTGGQFDPMRQQNGEQGSWWKSLLPTAGAVLGGLVPIPGLDIATAGLGAGLGKAAENALTGKAAFQGDDVTSALQGAAGQGIGNVLGAITGKVMGLGSQGFEKGSDLLRAGQFANGTIDKKAVADLMNTHGMSSANEFEPLTRVLSGNTEMAGPEQALITKHVENAVSKQPTFDGSGIVGTYNKSGIQLSGQPSELDMLLQDPKEAAGLSVRDEANLKAEMSRDMTKLQSGEQSAVGSKYGMGATSGTVPTTAIDPSNALAIQRSWANTAASLRSKAMQAGGTDTGASLMAKSNVYDTMSNTLKDRIYAAPQGEGFLPLNDNAKKLLISQVQAAGEKAGVNPTAIRQVTDKIASVDNLRDLNSIPSPYIGASQAFGKTEDIAARNYGMTTSDLARAGLPITGGIVAGPKGAIAGMAGAAMKNPTVDKYGASILSKLSDVTGSKTAQNVVKQAERIAAITAATSPNLAAPPSQSTVPGGSINLATPGQGAGMQGQPESEFNNVIQSLMQAMMLDPNQFAGAGSNIIGAAIPQLIKTAQGQAMLPGLLAAFQNAGGAQGLPGAVSRATGMIPGTAQNALNAQSGQLANILGINPGMVPNVMQAPGTAGIQTNTLQSILQATGGQPTALPVQ